MPLHVIASFTLRTIAMFYGFFKSLFSYGQMSHFCLAMIACSSKCHAMGEITPSQDPHAVRASVGLAREDAQWIR